MDLKDAWRKFRHGEALSDAQLQWMIDQVKAAMPYLQDTLPESYLAQREAHRALVALEGYQYARKRAKENAKAKSGK